MFKSSGLIILLLCIGCCFSAAKASVNDSDLMGILKESNVDRRDRALIKYLRSHYRLEPVAGLPADKVKMNDLFIRYRFDDRPAINYFIDYLYQQRLGNFDAAGKSLVKAINLVATRKEKYLVYIFYNELGFLQTDRGNPTEAVYSYNMAKKQAVTLGDPALQIIVYINISDAFYRNGFYAQSLHYLQQAQSLVAQEPNTEHRYKNSIYNNIIENYYRIGNTDSVKKYNRLLHLGPDSVANKHPFTKLTDYYLSLLQGEYFKAVKQIQALKTDSLYEYNNSDEQNLAKAYYHAGMPDSARNVLTRLVADPLLKNHPEIKYRLYELLGRIAEERHDLVAAAYNFKMAFQQSAIQVNRLSHVDNIASQIKVEKVEGDYLEKEQSYKRERQGLIYVLIISILTIAIIGMIFSATRQKRRYERLVFDNKKKELSFINSHEVRRHLSNIWGLINLIKHSDNKHEQYLEAEPLLLREAESLDRAIKSISEKLESDVEIIKPTAY
jgi:hypothetical protein